ncbi:hypothetical protein [Ferrimonas senticii]|uniref:hypothetical protein n=1 Tax=Ferrimonas senticii TaxID=394566 RepID=UPI0004186BEB|nr:hypothetical protein [Ferrimonas senticii]
MLTPIGLTRLPSQPSSVSGARSAAVIDTSATAASVNQALVLPSSTQDWAQFQQHRNCLQLDKPLNRGIDVYTQIAQQPLRQQLQQMVGVDMWV